MANQPDNLVLELLRGLRADVADVKAEVADLRADVATKPQLAEAKAGLTADIRSLRADVASDLLTTRKEHGDQIAGLRGAVIEYHSAVIGRGVLISEPEARAPRVEQHLNLPALDTH
jgi:hypothetical protein